MNQAEINYIDKELARIQSALSIARNALYQVPGGGADLKLALSMLSGNGDILKGIEARLQFDVAVLID